MEAGVGGTHGTFEALGGVFLGLPMVAQLGFAASLEGQKRAGVSMNFGGYCSFA